MVRDVENGHVEAIAAPQYCPLVAQEGGMEAASGSDKLSSGIPTGSHKKEELHFVANLTVNYRYGFTRTFTDPPPPILSEIISSDLDESQGSILWCKKGGFPPFGGRLASLCPMHGGESRPRYLPGKINQPVTSSLNSLWWSAVILI